MMSEGFQKRTKDRVFTDQFGKDDHGFLPHKVWDITDKHKA